MSILSWKLDRVAWYRMGNCWNWAKIDIQRYYSGNQIWLTWGRFAIVLERNGWMNDEIPVEAEIKEKEGK